MAATSSRAVQTSLPYLARDALYEHEKPFGADFPVDRFDGAHGANHIFDSHPVVIHDVRGAKPLCLEENGFQFIKASTSLTAADATNTKTPAVAKYLKEVEAVLYENFPEYERIEVMDFQVRKRAPGFPHNLGVRVEYEQPAAMPHTDFSIDGAFMRMEEAFPGQEVFYRSRSFDLLKYTFPMTRHGSMLTEASVWRVLKGPNDDWPLALCDYESVDFKLDTIANDCLHQTRTGENWLLQANPGHQWYYMSAQAPDDLIVFRNTDSEGKRARAFHTSFCNPLANCEPRHSIELSRAHFGQAIYDSPSSQLNTSLLTAHMSTMKPIVVGNARQNFWLFSNRYGFDLTHPASPYASPVTPRLTLQSKYNAPVTIAPSKTALVIIDMQNFFLSAAMGRSKGGGHAAEESLLKHGIPAAREAGIRIVHVTWGITEETLQAVPPTVWRIFGWNGCDDGMYEVEDDEDDDEKRKIQRKEKKSDGGLGTDIGNVTLEDGKVQAAGQVLMKDQWNTELHGGLPKSFEEGQKAKVPDVRFHKTRLSGFWDVSSSLHRFLEKEGITTLLFTGVNTDQCVLASIQDACNQGFDTVMLEDGCGTTSPDFATEMCIYNCQKSFGFVSSCEELEKAVMEMA